MGNEEAAAPTDDKLFRPEALISYLLRGGVAVSFVLIVLGTTISFIRHPDYLRSHECFSGSRCLAMLCRTRGARLRQAFVNFAASRSS